jgi:hypothetical protein
MAKLFLILFFPVLLIVQIVSAISTFIDNLIDDFITSWNAG